MGFKLRERYWIICVHSMVKQASWDSDVQVAGDCLKLGNQNHNHNNHAPAKHLLLLVNYALDCSIVTVGMVTQSTSFDYISIGPTSSSYITSCKHSHRGQVYPNFFYYIIQQGEELTFFCRWPFWGEDDRGKTSPRALVFTRCDIQSERH